MPFLFERALFRGVGLLGASGQGLRHKGAHAEARFQSHYPKVVGSNPAPATKIMKRHRF